MGTSVPLATWAIPCSKVCLAPPKALIRAAWFASSDQAALLLPKVANPKAITNIRFLPIMLTSCVLRRIALLATALSWPSVDRELKLAAIDLEFARGRLAFLFAGSKALLQADLGETAAPGNSISAVVIVIIIVPQDGIVAGNAY